MSSCSSCASNKPKSRSSGPPAYASVMTCIAEAFDARCCAAANDCTRKTRNIVMQMA